MLICILSRELAKHGRAVDNFDPNACLVCYVFGDAYVSCQGNYAHPMEIADDTDDLQAGVDNSDLNACPLRSLFPDVNSTCKCLCCEG